MSESTYLQLPHLDVVGVLSDEAQRLQTTQSNVTRSRSVFHQQAGGYQINDVLKVMPGVYTGGGPGEDKDIRLRGLDKDFTRIQLDGIQLPDSGEKREMNVERIPASMIESITILRNNTAEYEADGLAGRVIMETRKIPKSRKLEMDISAGDAAKTGDKGRQVAMTYGERFDNQFGLQGSLSFADQPLTKQKDKISNTGVLSEQEFEDKPTQYLSLMLDAAYFYDNGEFHIKPIVFKDEEDKQKTKLKYNNDGITLKEKEAENELKDKLTKGITFENKHLFSKDTKLETNLGFYSTEENKDKIKRKLNANAVENTAKRELEKEDKQDQFWQFDSKLSHQWNGLFDHTVKTGISTRFRERYREKDKFVNGLLVSGEAKDGYKLDENYYAAFVQDQIWLTERWSVLPGVRYEHVDLTSRDGEGVKASHQYQDLLPSLATSYLLTDTLKAHASYSQVVNRPKYDELAPYEQEKGDKFTLGNPNVDPARAHAFEIGLDYVTDPLFIAVNLFYRDISDVIETRETGEIREGKPVEQIQNVGDGYLRGIEFEQRLALSVLKLPFLKGFTVTANQTWIDSELENADGSKTPFKDQPDFLANLIIDWYQPVWGTRASVSTSYTSDFKQNDINDGRDSETYVDVRISQRLSNNIDAYLLAENLTDEKRTKFKSNGEIDYEQSGKIIWLGLNSRF